MISPPKKKYVVLELEFQESTMGELRFQGFEESDAVGLENLCEIGTYVLQVGFNLKNLKTKSGPGLWKDRKMAYCISS